MRRHANGLLKNHGSFIQLPVSKIAGQLERANGFQIAFRAPSCWARSLSGEGVLGTDACTAIPECPTRNSMRDSNILRYRG